MVRRRVGAFCLVATGGRSGPPTGGTSCSPAPVAGKTISAGSARTGREKQNRCRVSPWSSPPRAAEGDPRVHSRLTEGWPSTLATRSGRRHWKATPSIHVSERRNALLTPVPQCQKRSFLRMAAGWRTLRPNRGSPKYSCALFRGREGEGRSRLEEGTFPCGHATESNSSF